MNLQCFR